MPYAVKVYRVVIASPSDVTAERLAIPEVIYGWNALHSFDFRAVLLPVKWETHATPIMGERPQSIINKQLVSESDVLVGVFWTRLGTPTGTAESGSVEEINEFRSRNKPVLLYFSNAPVLVKSVDIEQYDKLKDFKEKCFKEGLVSVYNSLADFREQLYRHLLDTVRRLNNSSRNEYDPLGLTDSSPSQVMRTFLVSYEAFVNRLEAEWANERHKTPADLEAGKSIFQRVSDALLDFRTHLVCTLYPELAGELDGVLRRAKPLHQYQVIIGETDYQNFWNEGDIVVTRIKDIPRMGRQLLRITPSSTIEVHFLHPRSSTTLSADVSLECTGKEALNALIADDGRGAFLTPTDLGDSYVLVVARTQKLIEESMTFGEAEVQNGDMIRIFKDGQYGG